MAAPRRRATTALRPGPTGNSSAVTPSFCRTPKTYFAATCSLPGGLVVLILTRSCSQTLASPVSEVRSPRGEVATGAAGVGTDGNWAASGRVAPNQNGAAHS